MNITSHLNYLGQRIWLDNITRLMLTSGTFSRYIRDYAVTGLTSSPTIFAQAISHSDCYDEAIYQKALQGRSGEKLFFELAIEDLGRAADMFRSTYDRTDGVDGWVSLEVSPLLAADSAGTINAALQLHAQAQRANLFIKIPGTPEGLMAVEEVIFAGVPVNVTLLFSRAQFLAAAAAYMRGIERRVQANLDPCVASVASIFVRPWDEAVNAGVSPALQNRLGIAVSQSVYQAYHELMSSPWWLRLAAGGARPQRLLWASTGTRDPMASDTLYVEALATPDTINCMPELTLLAVADHGRLTNPFIGNQPLIARELDQFAEVGIDIDVLAQQLQQEGTDSIVKAWKQLIHRIALKSLPPSTAGDIGERSAGLSRKQH